MSQGTDAMGYRSNGSVPSQGTASVESRRAFLTSKRPILNTPGSDIVNPFYYDKFSCSVQAAEMQNMYGRDSISFNSFSTIGQANIYIPNCYLVGNVFIHAQLNGGEISWSSIDATRKASYVNMPAGYGFGMIQDFTYYLGSSSVANVTISGESNMVMCLSACDTREKRQAMIAAAGKLLLGAAELVNGGVDLPTGDNLLAPQADNKLVFRNRNNFDRSAYDELKYVDEYDPSLLNFRVPCRLPWSSYSAQDRRLPFDTKLLNQPIQLAIRMRRGFGKVSGLVNGDSFGQMLQSAEIQYEQLELSDKSLSLRNTLLANPDYNTGLPFLYSQSMQFPVPASNGGVEMINVTSFMNADLRVLHFLVAPTLSEREASGNYVQFFELEEISLVLNGQTYFRYQSDSYNGIESAIELGDRDALFGGGIKTASASTSRIIKTAGRYNVYEINMSRIRALISESHMENTPRFTNQTMRINFTIKNTALNRELAGQGAFDDVDAVAGNMFCTYNYNAVFQVGGSGGTSTLYTE